MVSNKSLEFQEFADWFWKNAVEPDRHKIYALGFKPCLSGDTMGTKLKSVMDEVRTAVTADNKRIREEAAGGDKFEESYEDHQHMLEFREVLQDVRRA